MLERGLRSAGLAARKQEKSSPPWLSCAPSVTLCPRMTSCVSWRETSQRVLGASRLIPASIALFCGSQGFHAEWGQP